MFYRFKSTQSFSHLTGCVTAHLVTYIRSAFGDKFFKSVRITSEAPFFERKNWLRSVAKKPRPLLVIDPKFDVADESEFLPNSEWDGFVANDPEDRRLNLTNNLVPILLAKDGKYMVFGKLGRYKMSFNVTFAFDSDVQTIQSQEHIRQNIRHKITNVLDRYLEYNIPSNFINAAAFIEGMDSNTVQFMDLLNSYSKNPITHRVRSGSGNKEFFVMEKTNLHVLFTALPSYAGPEKKGKVVTSSTFTENVEIEFSAISAYYFETDVDLNSINMADSNLGNTAVSPVVSYSFPLLQLKEPTENYDTELYRKILEITIQFDTADVDSLDISKYIKGQIGDIYAYHKERGLIMDFLKCRCMEDYTPLGEDRLSFDASTLVVSVTNTDAFRVYRFTAYANFKYINKLEQSLHSLSDYQNLP
jgi:hypothetical protein